MMMIDFLIKRKLEGFFSDLVLERGDMMGMIAIAEILDRKDAQWHPSQLEEMRQSLWHSIYCTLVYFAGQLVGSESTQRY